MGNQESYTASDYVTHPAFIEALTKPFYIDKTAEGNTPLHWAKNPSEVLSLIQNGANIHARNDYGNTPLHNAINGDVARTLIQNGADIHARNDYGGTPLFCNQTESKIRVLIEEYGADINAVANDGATVLHHTYNFSTIHTLLLLGAKVNERDNKGETPLGRFRYIFCDDKEKIEKLLIEYGGTY